MRYRARDIALAFLLALFPAAPLAAAELRFTPTFGVTEDVTDNADETVSKRRSEFLTVLQPGFGLQYSTPSSELAASYNLNYRYYARGTRSNETSHTAALLGSFALIDQFLKVDVSDTFSRVSIDVARSNIAETGYNDQTDSNTATISPYLLWRLGDKMELKTGARYTDIRYWSPDGIDKEDAGVFADVHEQWTARLGFDLRYVFNRTRTEAVTYLDDTGTLRTGRVSYRDHSVSGGFRYDYAEGSALFGSVSRSWQDFSYRGNAAHFLWDGGIIQQFGGTTAVLEGKSRYAEDPLTVSERQTTYSVKIDKLLRRGTVGVAASYDRYLAADAVVYNRHTGRPTTTTAGATSRRGVTVSLTGTRELSANLTSSLTLTGDKFNHRVSLDYPYHLVASWTLNYLLGPKTTVDFTYTYASYRHKPLSARDSVDINRAVVQFRRSF